MSVNNKQMSLRIDSLSVAGDEWPQELCLQVAIWRIQTNLKETGHPFHHQAANGAIVDADPTTEYLVKRLSLSQQRAIHSRFTPSSTVLPTVPVNRRYYGIDPYGEAQ